MKNEKKILFIDPLSPKGHVNFNTIYIKYLYESYQNIDFAFKMDYDKHFEIKTDAIIYSIPEKLYRQTNNKFLSRLYLFRIFRYIYKECNLQKYDFVLMSSFEEISLYIANYKTPLILVHHNNFKSIDNPLKLFFYKRIANKNINIVFEQYMKECHKKLGIKNTHVVHHGLPIEINKNILIEPVLKNQFSCLNKFDIILFSPSGSSVDNDFMIELISNKFFLSFLNEKNILFILKGKFYNNQQSKNIMIIDKYLSDKEYEYLFLRSSVILINYPSSHKYRVSAVLFECMSNDKLCVVSKIESLSVYKDYFKYDPFFASVHELMERIESIIALLNSGETNPYKNKQDLQPNFEEVFNFFSSKTGFIDID